MIFGDSRPYLVALITPSQDMITLSAAKKDAEGWLQKQIFEAIQTANANLSPPEKVRQFIITDEAFSLKMA